MFHIQHIESLDLPELAPYRTMQQQLEHRQQGVFIAEGEKVVRRLLESSYKVISLLVQEKWFEDFKPLLAKRSETIEVYIASQKYLEQWSGNQMFQGALALGCIPPPSDLDTLLKKSLK